MVYPNEDGNIAVYPISVQLIDFGLARRRPADDGAKMPVEICGGYDSPIEIAFAPSSVRAVAYTGALDVRAFGCLALQVGCNGIPPFWSSHGRSGIRDEILDTFGSPLEALIRKHGWVDEVSIRIQRHSVSWGLWPAKTFMVTIQRTLRYDMDRRPDMQTCRDAFVNEAGGGG